MTPDPTASEEKDGRGYWGFVIWLVVVIASLLGCSRSSDPFPGYKKGSGNVGGFILQCAMSLGAHPIKTNGLPKVQAKWRYKTDADGIQIYVVGDSFVQVRSFFLTAFGSPAFAFKTNDRDEISGGSYSGLTSGAAMLFHHEQTGDGNDYTEVVITRAGSVKP